MCVYGKIEFILFVYRRTGRHNILYFDEGYRVFKGYDTTTIFNEFKFIYPNLTGLI